ncbi:hypothetical protein ACQ4PT_003575 [Festuca glaucescens]
MEISIVPTASALAMPVIIGVLVMQLVSAMAASSPNKIGMANCTTSCGGVEVTYPFGIGPDSRCYLQPGFNLTCDTRHDPPRLLLLDGLRVDYIGESSIKVFHTVGTTPSLLGGALDRPGGAPYSLADGNELVLTGCNVQATLLRNGNVTVGSCSLCHEKDDVDAGLSSFMNGAKILRHDEVLRDRCSGLGCCLAPTIVGASHDADAMMSASLGIELHWFGRKQQRRQGASSRPGVRRAERVVRLLALELAMAAVVHGSYYCVGGSRFSGLGAAPGSGNAAAVLLLQLQWCLQQQTQQASLLGSAKGPDILNGCVSFCSIDDDDNGGEDQTYVIDHRRRGPGARTAPEPHQQIHLGWLYPESDFAEKTPPPAYVFIAQEGWFDELGFSGKLGPNLQPPSRAALEVPMVLKWEVLSSNQNCSGNICKSKHSYCKQGDRGYTCHCESFFDGNPYVDDGDGCKDLNGHFIARLFFHMLLERMTNNVYTFTGISVGIGLASAVGLIIMVLIGRFISNKVKHQKAQMLKRKFFEQNRGQLLQQLVSQRADIAERMIVPLEELEKATNNFDKARELGGGGHGTVYKGILSDLHVVAIKKPKKVVQREIDEFINEVAILSQINHRNVVKLYGCCLETEVPMLVYEFISNGTLYEHLHINGPRSLSWDNRLRIAIEAAKSLAYLHSTASTPIIHRDVKSANILLDDTLTAKVADFGASRYISVEKSGLTTMVQGTIGYLDPMYFYTGRLTEKSDVYSYGVMLVELLTRKKPFQYLSPEGDGLVAHFVALFAEGNLSEILDPQVIDEGGKEIEEAVALAVTCIKLKGEDRPTMRQVELRLEGLRPSKDYTRDGVGINKLDTNGIGMNSTSIMNGRSNDGLYYGGRVDHVFEVPSVVLFSM